MDSSFKGYVLDPLKCSKLSMEEKRELVYEISKCSHGCPEMLQSWSRQELLQILCAEMGKERKYTSLPKSKLIEILMRILSKKKSLKRIEGLDLQSQPSSATANSQTTSKRPRKNENPSRLPFAENHFSINNSDEDKDTAVYCQNPACRAALCRVDAICKMCSCYICHLYDYDKDPSLWLFCSPEPPHQGASCGISCHLECALKHEGAGIAMYGHHAKLDGSFYCASCGKVNGLLRSLREQLFTAKDTREMEVLCFRLSLSQKLLSGTKKYQDIHEIVDSAVKKLEAEVGPLSGFPVTMAERNVSSLSTGLEVQKLCASALESLDSMLPCGILLPPSKPEMQDSSLTSPGLIRFENVSPTSVTVVLGFEDTTSVWWYNLWHRRADVKDYPTEPNCTLFKPNLRFSFFHLTPSTKYFLKVVSFCNMKELEMWEVRFITSSAGNNVEMSLVVERGHSPGTSSSSLSNLSEGDDSNNLSACEDKIDNPRRNYFGYKKTEIPDSSKLSDGATKDVCETQNRSIDTRQDETPEDSVSVVNDEFIMEEMGPLPNLKVHKDPQKIPTHSSEGNQVSNVLQLENSQSLQGQFVKEISTYTGSNNPVGEGLEIVPFEHGFDGTLPFTHCESDIGKDGSEKSWILKPEKRKLDNLSWNTEDPRNGNLSEKRIIRRDQKRTTARSLEDEYVHCVKVVRSLEHKRYIEKNFREKFLTWYSLRATPEERRLVKGLLDTLIDKPLSLSGQLIETFSERIFSKRLEAVPSGFCRKLSH